MNKSQIVDELSQLNPQIFPFAYALIYDELQAQQLVIDAISYFITNSTEQVEDYFATEEYRSKQLRLFEIKKNILGLVYKIAQKRIDQLRSSLSFKDDEGAFYSLSITQRAILFLKFKTNFEQTDIMDIMEIDNVEYYQLYSIAELNLSTNYNGEVVL